MNLRHLILTRFNVASPGKEAEIRLRPGWLDKRFELFRRYCLPGVASQSNAAFEWIVFFDQKTPAPYLDEIERLRETFAFQPYFTPLFRMGDMTPALAGARADAEWLLTTRLDSDDVLAVDFVERLQDLCRSKIRRVINFDDGVILAPGGAQPALYRTQDDCNPFASLLEPAGDGVQTIWGANHRDIARLGPIDNVAGPPAWMQVVHGDNVSNEIRGSRVSASRYADLFPRLDLAAMGAAERPALIAGENLVQRPARLARRLGRRLATRFASVRPSR